MKNFNWGHGIALFYIVFVGVLVTALIASFGVDHSLVDKAYYEKDIAYQSQYDKTMNNLAAHALQLKYDKAKSEISIEMKDAQHVSGTAHFYRPSDQSQDFNTPLSAQKQLISSAKLMPGKWIVKIDATVDGVAYYKEEMLYL